MRNLSTVWVVDDDTDDQFLIEDALKRIDPAISIKQLTDGQELLACLAHTAYLPELVLLDLNMQRMNGLETLKALRDTPTYQRLPVVILTTSNAANDKARSTVLGADGFLTKPSSQTDLVAMLQQLTTDWLASE